MSETCPRCESAVDQFGICENGHRRGNEWPDVPARQLEPEPSDAINPEHYRAGKIECIDAIMSAIDGMQAQHAICVGNVIKYLWRLHRKGEPLENAKKASWYLERLVKELS